jgi:hypothetical protein
MAMKILKTAMPVPLLVLQLAATAYAASLQDGEYSCSLNSRTVLGSIWIKGDTYVGPSFDRGDPAHRFQVTERGTVNWSAPLGGMDTGGNHVVGTVIKDAGGGKTGFDIQLQTETGNFHTVSCDPQF